MSTRNRTTSPAPFATLTSTTDHAAPLAAPMSAPATLTHDAKAAKAKAAKPQAAPKPRTQAKAAPKPQAQAQAPQAQAQAPQAAPLHGKAAPKPYVYPGDRDKVSAGTIINAMLALPQGATHAEMVDALVSNMPANYAHNIKAATAKAHSHPRTVAAYAAKAKAPALAVTVDPAGRYRAPQAAHWQTVAGGGKCSGGVVVRVDANGKPLDKALAV